MLSKTALFATYIFMFCVTFWYYPKWQKQGSEAAISWDVSGYYWYLPSFFIYKDAKQQSFADSLIKHYKPTPDFQQAYRHESGNYVMKYSSGLAVQLLPFFAVAHWAAPLLGFPADGFSLPYQFAVQFGSLFAAFIGLWLLRRLLLRYFSDGVTATVLLLMVFATNYLAYTAINGAMTHNWLFTLYCFLILYTIRFYERPTSRLASAIGVLIGLAMLTRPTEVIVLLLPLLWGIVNRKDLQQRMTFIQHHFSYFLLATVCAGAVGFLQLAYWKYASGHWLVYSYQDQSFSWLRPHLYNGLFSFRAGWLVYTPIMLFALIGFVPLYHKKFEGWWAIFIFMLLYIYITFAWDIWWYGGSLGQRAMVQSYAVLAFPIAAFIQMIQTKRSIFRWAFVGIALLFSYYNLWMTHQAHRGGMFFAGDMTRAYFWKILGRYSVDQNALKLLDTKEEYAGQRKNVNIIAQNNFEQDTTLQTISNAIEGGKSFLLNIEHPYSPTINAPLTNGAATWLRASVTIQCIEKEWDVWKMTRWVVRFRQGENTIKESVIRLQRLVGGSKVAIIYLDARLPKKPFDNVVAYCWNPGSSHPILLDNLLLETFDPQ